MFKKVKGVADIFFEMPYWTGVQKKIEAHVQRYNFSKVELPILEHVPLFTRGLGSDTEVVSKQMFIIAARGTSEDSVCLRPEGTAGTMRAFLENQSQLVTPCKVFSYGPMFRYERPQKGRMREFHQFNLELIGSASILEDAHMIKMLHSLFSEVLKVPDFILKLNFLGQREDRAAFTTAFVNFLTPHTLKLCADCQSRILSNPLRVLDCKSEECHKVFADAPKLSNYFSDSSRAQWQLLRDTLQELSVTFVIDNNLVRGLDYYNKTVFEFISLNLGAQNTFCGGGRYDDLAEQLGSKQQVPALGCAMGMERLLMILEPQRDRLSEKQVTLSCIIPMEQAQQILALHLADYLQFHGKAIDVILDDGNIKNKMKKANALKATYVLILGPDEQNNNTVMVKNMITGEQEVVLQPEVIHKI